MANKAFVPTNMKLTHQQETRKSNVAETLYPSRITLHLPTKKKKKKKKKTLNLPQICTPTLFLSS
jgi:hypothetical protein